MDTFSALADPTRRSILELVAAHGELSTSDICHKFSITQPAISQHLKVLRESELLVMEKRAQLHLYTINDSKLLEVESWIQRMTKVWNARFDRLEKLLQKEKSTYISHRKAKKHDN